MSERPPVPDWICTFSYPGWTNVFRLVPKNENLYGTETLFGDWNARILLLAKDGAPTGVIRALRDRGESQEFIACLGHESWFLMCQTMENLVAASNFQQHRDNRQRVKGRLGERKIRAFPLYHPAARVSSDLMESGWRDFAKSVKLPARQVKVVKLSVN